MLITLAGSHEWRAAAGTRVQAAVARGNSKIGPRLANAYAGGAGAVAASVVTYTSIAFIPDQAFESPLTWPLIWAAWLILNFALAAAGGYFGWWIIPSLEIATPGHTNLWRTVRLLGPIVVAIALAGITKQVFG